MSRARPRRRVVRAAALIAVLALSGCGGDDDDAPTAAEPSGLPAAEAPQANRVVDPAAPPPSINALDIDPVANEFLLTTNRGFFRIGRDSGEITQVRGTVRSGATTANVGTSLELAVSGRGRLIGSGHPDQGGALPEFLGVMTSADGGRTWRVVSRLGEADLHRIVMKHDRMYGFDAVTGALLVSRDDAKTFSEQFTPSGVPIADLEVDPANPRRIVAASDAEMYRSTNGGAAWKPLGGASGARLAWPARDALYRALKDGGVQVSGDGGSSWETAGRIDGEPYRLKAVSREELYLVIGDGTILHTRDGAKTWDAAFKP
ncbi:MAG: hypothetical protein Q8K79_09575 [Solirubrobacteraceae bacterium]|nr:hypothetical protein [Solirubrobacteraceae bacterium]